MLPWGHSLHWVWGSGQKGSLMSTLPGHLILVPYTGQNTLCIKRTFLEGGLRKRYIWSLQQVQRIGRFWCLSAKRLPTAMTSPHLTVLLVDEQNNEYNWSIVTLLHSLDIFLDKPQNLARLGCPTATKVHITWNLYTLYCTSPSNTFTPGCLIIFDTVGLHNAHNTPYTWKTSLSLSQILDKHLISNAHVSSLDRPELNLHHPSFLVALV